MKEKKIYCYLNGKILEKEKLAISPYDIGMLRGFAIYEAITTHGGKPFFLGHHLKRFRKSAKELGLKVPIPDKKIGDILEVLIKKNNFKRTNFRLILSGGEAMHGVEFNPHSPTFFILAEEWKPLPENIYKDGAKLITYEHLRFMPNDKTTHYITAVTLQKKKNSAKAIEILYVSRGLVLECSTSNIFIFKGDRLITPKTNILPGVTREVVLNLAKKDFKVEERDIKIPELLGADEVFICASYKDIVPIVKVDSRKIGRGVVGENTKKIMQLFRDFVTGY